MGFPEIRVAILELPINEDYKGIPYSGKCYNAVTWLSKLWSLSGSGFRVYGSNDLQ